MTNTTSIPEFQQYQHQFVDYLRNPHADQILENTLPEASQIYAELYYSGIEGCLQRCFPNSRALLGENIWQKVVQLFIKEHRCQSPLYREIPNEFMAYLLNAKPGLELPEFINDLAHYEWMELIIETAESNQTHANFPRLVAPLSMVPVLNPVLHLLHYRYPVQHISATDDYWQNWQNRLEPYEQVPIILAGFRAQDDQVKFVELNAITARLIELLQGETRNQEHILLQLADEINFSDPIQFMQFGREILQQLSEQQIIIGAINEHNTNANNI